MPRIARGALNGGVFHVLNRGNHRQMLFRGEEEFAAFLDLLACSVAKFPVRLWGYCLMGNHWHLVVQVSSTLDLSRWVHWLCNRQVRQLHSENAHLGCGHLYQGRYKSFPVQDESYLANVLRYVEANPLRARLVGRAEDWLWSSLSIAPVRPGLVEVARPRLAEWPRDERWLAAVNQPLAAAQLDGLRQSVVRGTPQGNPGWTATLVGFPAVEQSRNARMLQAREEAAFSAETAQYFVGVNAALEEFDGDLLLEPAVLPPREVHCAHAAAPDLAYDFVRAQTSPIVGRRVRILAVSRARAVGESFQPGRLAFEERHHLAPQPLVARAGTLDARAARGVVAAFQGIPQDRLDALPPLGGERRGVVHRA